MSPEGGARKSEREGLPNWVVLFLLLTRLLRYEEPISECSSLPFTLAVEAGEELSHGFV